MLLLEKEFQPVHLLRKQYASIRIPSVSLLILGTTRSMDRCPGTLSYTSKACGRIILTLRHHYRFGHILRR